VHDLAFLEFPRHYSRFERAYYALNIFLLRNGRHKIVVPSAYVRTQLERRCRISPARIHVIPPFCGFDARKSGEKSQDRKYFVLLSNAHPRKNIEATVEGYLRSGADRAGYKLKIIGNFERDIPGHWGDSVEVLPGLSDEDLQRQVHAASALLLFSLSEGFGYPVLEAATLRTISITSECGSLAELTAPGRDTWTAITPTEIAEKISKFLNDQAYRELLKMDADHVREQYGRQRFAADWTRLIEEVMADEAGSA
jgi:glycosyltransferase involved in cell wall biosynthesis